MFIYHKLVGDGFNLGCHHKGHTGLADDRMIVARRADAEDDGLPWNKTLLKPFQATTDGDVEPRMESPTHKMEGHGIPQVG